MINIEQQEQVSLGFSQPIQEIQNKMKKKEEEQLYDSISRTLGCIIYVIIEGNIYTREGDT